jgi:hypothetical protein
MFWNCASPQFQLLKKVVSLIAARDERFLRRFGALGRDCAGVWYSSPETMQKRDRPGQKDDTNWRIRKHNARKRDEDRRYWLLKSYGSRTDWPRRRDNRAKKCDLDETVGAHPDHINLCDREPLERDQV